MPRPQERKARYIRFFRTFEWRKLNLIQMEQVAQLLSNIIDQNRKKK